MFHIQECLSHTGGENILPFYLQVAKKFVDGKKTMASSGHLKSTPFVDEI